MTAAKRALITGITGQDGSYLAELPLADGSRLVTLLATIDPAEVYNLAAQSHVRVSFDEPVHTGEITGVGAIRLLEAVRLAGVDCRFYQASSSEMFGASPPPKNEDTPFHPRSPYCAAKVYCYRATHNYREAYGMFATNGILFNHELYLGNLDAIRDWAGPHRYTRQSWSASWSMRTSPC